MNAHGWKLRDGSIWGSSLPHPGYIVRLDPGSNPPDTALAELYKVPAARLRHPRQCARGSAA
jgi:hypothetical protein